MINQSMSVFESEYLDAATMATAISAPIPMRGNKVMMMIMVINHTGSGNVTFNLEGSYDGKKWDNIASSSALSTFGPATAGSGSVDCAWVRVRAVATSTFEVLFDTTLACSSM